MKCYRCGKDVKHLYGSYFNGDSLCEECVEREEKHPLYPLAKKAVDYEEETGKSIWNDFPELAELEGDEAPRDLYLIPRDDDEKEEENYSFHDEWEEGYRDPDKCDEEEDFVDWQHILFGTKPFKFKGKGA